MRSTPKKSSRKRELSKTQMKKQLSLSEANVEESRTQLEECYATINKLQSDIEKKDDLIKETQRKNIRFKSELYDYEHRTFAYENLVKNGSDFEYLCGLDKEKINLMDCVKPYLHLIPYTESKVTEKLMSFNTQLLVTLTICRHGLDYGFMAYILP